MATTIVCPSCRRNIPADAKFCPYCRASLATASLMCASCQKAIPADANFCPFCRTPVAGRRPPIQEHRWARGADDFATRVDVQDVPGFFSKSLVVEPGVRALILEDGVAARGELSAGRYTLHTFLGTLHWPGAPNRFTAILVDAGDVSLTFELNGLYTRDPIPVALTATVLLRLTDAQAFLINVLKGQVQMGTASLRDLLTGEVTEAGRAVLATCAAADLTGAHDPRNRLESEIGTRLALPLARWGLSFVSLRTADYHSERLEGVRQLQGEYWLLVSEAEAKLHGRQRLADVLSAHEVQDVAEEVRKVALHRERVRVWAQLREVLLSDRMDEIHNAEALAAVVAEVDRTHALRQHEVDTLKQLLAEQGADRQATRAHLLARVELERQREVRLGELALRKDVEQEELTRNQEIESRRLEGMMALETRRWQAELERRTQETAAQRAQQAAADMAQRQRTLQDALNELEVAKAKAKTQAEIDRIEREEDRLDMELGALSLERMHAVRRKEDAERMRMELERKAAEIQQEMGRAAAEMERRLREEAERHRLEMERKRHELEQERQRQEFELTRTRTLAEQGVAGLMTLATTPEQARLLKDVALLAQARDLSPAQLEMVMAALSPDLARALAEKFKAQAAVSTQAGQAQPVYERLLVEMKAMGAEQAALQERYAERMQGMYDKGMDTTLGTAQANAGRVEPPAPPVILPPAPIPPASTRRGRRRPATARVQADDEALAGDDDNGDDAADGADHEDAADDAAGAEGRVTCSRCQQQTPTGRRFCMHCGEDL